jgi:hypothetical protein
MLFFLVDRFQFSRSFCFCFVRIDTAGTLTAAANELKAMGAKRIFAFATHGK